MRNPTNALRFRKINNGTYNVKLDFYTSDGKGGHNRTLEDLDINVTQNYTGKRKFKAEDAKQMKVAEGILARKNLEKSQRVNDFKVKKDKPDFKFLPYLHTYATTKEDDGASRVHYQVKKYAGEDLMMSEITFTWLEAFQRYLKSNVAQNTEHRYLYKLKQVLKYAKKLKIIDDHNFYDIKIVGVAEADITTLTIEEVKMLANTPVDFEPHVKQAFLFSCFSGLRISDIEKLTWNELKDNRINIRPQKTSAKKLNVPMSPGAIELLKEIDKSDTTNKVFHNLPSRSKIRLDLIKWGEDAELDKRLHYHASRHSFATIGLTHGIDIYTMQKLLGHSKITQTTVYAKIVDEKKDTEIAKFPTL